MWCLVDTGSRVVEMMDKLREVDIESELRMSRGPKTSSAWKPGKTMMPYFVGGERCGGGGGGGGLGDVLDANPANEMTSTIEKEDWNRIFCWLACSWLALQWPLYTTARLPCFFDFLATNTFPR